MASSQRFQTDALNPSSLPSARIGRNRQSLLDTNNTIPPGERQKAELDNEYEDWNNRIDREVKSITTSLEDLVSLADVSLPLHHSHICHMDVADDDLVGRSE